MELGTWSMRMGMLARKAAGYKVNYLLRCSLIEASRSAHYVNYGW
jgi:hypothetical protein